MKREAGTYGHREDDQSQRMADFAHYKCPRPVTHSDLIFNNILGLVQLKVYRQKLKK